MTFTIRITLFLFLNLLVFPALAAESRTYDWVTAGEVSGSMVLTVDEQGSRSVSFEFNDRGRGPKLEEATQLGANGLPESYRVSGNSYMGAPVEEKFQRQNGVARWKSTLEQGESPETAFYIANDGTPEQLAVLARALLKSPDASLALFPAGKARIQEVLTHRFDGVEAVSLYAITGLDLTPQYLWLDEDRELFALVFGWMGLVPQGRGADAAALQKIQDAEEEKYHRQLAFELTQKLPSNWVIRNVDVLDVTTGKRLENHIVAVTNGKIVRVAKDTGVAIPQSGSLEPRVIDGQGLTLIPGLWDMHTHLSLADGLLNIAAGVTTARDLANDPDRLPEVIAAFNDGSVIGPRVFKAGFIDGVSPYSAPTGKLAEDLDDALKMIREYAEAGYPQIKIYSSIDPQWVKPMADEIHKQGMRLSGHIPSFMSTEQAVRDGFDEIQHINMVFLNFLAGPEDDTRTPLRFTLVAEKAADLDLDSKEVTDFIALLKQRNVVVDPTVTIFEGMFRNKAGEIDPSYAMIADYLPPSLQRGFLAGELDINESNEAQFARSAEALLGMIGRLHKAGIPLVAGTDAIAGFTLHRELELYTQAGISNVDVLRLATLGSAEVAGVSDQTGSIAEGKTADFVLLAEDPLVNISAVRKPVAVFKGDRWYDSARLYESVGIRPFTR